MVKPHEWKPNGGPGEAMCIHCNLTIKGQVDTGTPPCTVERELVTVIQIPAQQQGGRGRSVCVDRRSVCWDANSGSAVQPGLWDWIRDVLHGVGSFHFSKAQKAD
eukprot:TRINITY_DN32430_c0_g1_i1.p1 TRINITY_DN32430_c0_g1~~TRINITY_DN32430_c0_g1_i1.p1  ORF type:complete len:105 (-),score=3.70 TRINITY_DN32430_c0_g1_i1:195-509(-)